MEKTIRTILDQAQNNNIRHGEHLKALAEYYTKVTSINQSNCLCLNSYEF